MQMRKDLHLFQACLVVMLAFGCGTEKTPSNEPLFVFPPPDTASTTDDANTVGNTAAENPKALVYLNDPVSDDNMLSEVTLLRPTSEDGRLTSEWVQVFNCLNEEGGDSASPNVGGFNITVNFCKEEQVVRPDADGHYLSVTPPEDDADPNDSFAEMMMYHHVNRAHDYFKEDFGLETLDFPLPALVNVQVKTDPVLPFLMPNPDGWIGLSNAAFFPEESWRQFAAQFGLPPRDSDSIIFFQGDKDFAYDSRVIYHEYTHAVIGTTRLQVPAVLDQYGLDNSAPSMNEGLADYFAASLANHPVIGRYVGVMDLGIRDLSKFRACPENTADEIHEHGELIGSTLWSLRESIGAELTDYIAFGALERFGLATTHTEAGSLLLEEAESISPSIGAKTQVILEAHGMLGCIRSMPLKNFDASPTRVPHLVEGRSSSGIPGLNEVVPAYKQFHIESAEDSAAVRIEWSVSAGGGGGFGGFGGGGGQPAALKVAYNRGTPVELVIGRRLTINSEETFEPTLAGGKQVLLLDRSCLPENGQLGHLLLLNPGNDQVQIASMKISTIAELSADDQPFTCGVDEQRDSEDSSSEDTNTNDEIQEDASASENGGDGSSMGSDEGQSEANENTMAPSTDGSDETQDDETSGTD